MQAAHYFCVYCLFFQRNYHNKTIYRRHHPFLCGTKIEIIVTMNDSDKTLIQANSYKISSYVYVIVL